MTGLTTTASKKPAKKKLPPVIQPIIGTHTQIGGLDPSLTRIGYAAPDGTLHSIVPDKIPERPTAWDLARRTNQLAVRLMRCIRLHPPAPTLMVIEAGFFMHPGASARLDQLRGVIREHLFDAGILFVEIPPDTLHLFATGVTGKAADKELMMHCACSRLRAAGVGERGMPKNYDEADAFHLRRMGRVGLGLEESLADYELSALAEDSSTVRWT